MSADEPTINMTAMIDVVFLLLIFFMVGTQFSERERQIEVKLPTVSTASPLTGLPDELVINITSDGSVVRVRETSGAGREGRVMWHEVR